VNDRSICPNAAFPDTEIQEHVPASENIRTTRISLGLLGDGFVEAVADETLIELVWALMANPQLRDLTGSAGSRVLVALPARLGVVKRP